MSTGSLAVSWLGLWSRYRRSMRFFCGHGLYHRSCERRRWADALALLAESSVRSYPTWIADLKRISPDGVDRRRYVYEKIRPGDSIELIREETDREEHAVAFRHRGVFIGYVPKGHFWIAHAIDDGRWLLAIVDKVKVGGIFRRRAKSVGVRIVVLNARQR